MTIANRAATDAYQTALNDMQCTRVGDLAALADKMAAGADDIDMPAGVKRISPDDMMNIETSIFVALCKANNIDWRTIA